MPSKLLLSSASVSTLNLRGGRNRDHVSPTASERERVKP